MKEHPPMPTALPALNLIAAEDEFWQHNGRHWEKIPGHIMRTEVHKYNGLLDNLSRRRINVGVGTGTIYNEYEFVGHGLRSDDSRERMEEAVDIIDRLWGGGAVTYNGKYLQVQVPQLRPRLAQRPHLPLWRGVISPSSFSECGRLGVPILTARLPVARIKERWAAYEAGLDARRSRDCLCALSWAPAGKRRHQEWGCGNGS